MIDLLASLSDEQAFLLRCAWMPYKEHHQWPIFDYIEAECDKQGIDARQTLASFSQYPLTSVQGFRYEHVWYNSHIPMVDTPILLRVLGLWHIADPFALEIVDEFLRVLNFLIDRRVSARYEPFKLNKVSVTNDDVAAEFPSMSPVVASFLPELLTHEPTTWYGVQRTDASGGWRIDVQRNILRYQGLNAVVDYLHRVGELLTPPEMPAQPAIPSPLHLPATLDYFNAVWQLHFDRKQPIIRLFGAERIARLAFEVSTAEEFSAQVSCIADILKNMQVSGQGKTPLARLRVFLQSRLPRESFNRVDKAIDTLAHVADVRNALFQHSGTEHRGVGALTRLGIAYPITDWHYAWAMIEHRAISALTAIREEIQEFHEIE
jgi:hypothetical protein